MKLTIRTRVLVVSVLGIVITVVGLSIPLVVAARQLVFLRADLQLEESALQGATRLVGALRAGDVTGVTARAQEIAAETGVRVSVVDADGRLAYDSDGAGPVGIGWTRNRPELRTALDGDIASVVRTSRTLGTDLLAVAAPVASDGSVAGAIRLVRPIPDVRADQRRATVQVVAVAVTVLSLGVVAALVASGSIARPLAEVTDAARRMGDGDRSARAPDAGPPEVRSLASTLNKAMDRVDAAAETERTFVTDAAHQLRTPLTALDLRLQLLADSDDLDEQRRRDVGAAIDETRALNRMLSQLLVLARAGGGAASILLEEPIDVTGALRNVAARARERCADAGVDLTVDIASDLPRVAVPSELVVQAVENLIDNVIRYCPDSDEARLAVARWDGAQRVVVADQGPGMDDDTAAHAFERFRRGTGEGPGTGLGLAIVEEVAALTGGDAALETGPDGTTVTFVLRSAPASDTAAPQS